VDRAVASFTGEFVDVSPSWMWQKPVQPRHFANRHLGARCSVTFRHVIELACLRW